MCLALSHHTSAAVPASKPFLAFAGLGVSPSAAARKESDVVEHERGGFTARQARLDPRIRQERHTGVCISHTPQVINSELHQRPRCLGPNRPQTGMRGRERPLSVTQVWNQPWAPQCGCSQDVSGQSFQSLQTSPQPLIHVALCSLLD